MKKIILILTALAVLSMTAGPSLAQQPLPPDPTLSGDFSSQYMGERIIVDVFILRPIGFAASLVGIGSAAAAYPFAAMSGSTDRVDRELIQKPWAYTFCRPVGDINF